MASAVRCHCRRHSDSACGGAPRTWSQKLRESCTARVICQDAQHLCHAVSQLWEEAQVLSTHSICAKAGKALRCLMLAGETKEAGVRAKTATCCYVQERTVDFTLIVAPLNSLAVDRGQQGSTHHTSCITGGFS